jgi:RHH-type proline utilization regulon transcriptional repressor/proline dehydrogenase/delta 1-pyrroline-5-carboxylate dehydrogenase
VPATALSLILAREKDASALVESPSVDAVVLTGATSTARSFLERRPDLRLFAETGGKNAFVITARADLDRAVSDLAKSAFGHAGQKCSAASVAIVEAEVHDDPGFQRRLRDAAASLKVGSAWDPASRVTPLIREPGPTLARGLTRLDAGESWLLEPREGRDNPRLWSPGIRMGVQPGSFCQRTELFGPVLSVVRARDLEHAIQIANDTEYGLVAGLSSLDEREQERFVDGVECGNLYVNRPMTGAIVGRQPFGGRKASSVGPGAKAGGPNYVAQLQRFTAVELCQDSACDVASWPPALSRFAALVEPLLGGDERQRLQQAVDGFVRAHRDHFSRQHDPWRLLGQDNHFRYRTCRSVLVYAGRGAKLPDALACVAAGLVAGVGLRLAGAVPLDARWQTLLARAAGELGFGFEDRPPSAERLSALRPERVRWLGDPDARLLSAARSAGVDVCFREVTPSGRLELCCYFQEQSVSIDYHRHGHLGFRTLGEDYSPGFTTNSKATFSPSGPAGRGP